MSGYLEVPDAVRGIWRNQREHRNVADARWNDIFEVETEFGLVQIEKKDIKKYQCKVFMNDGNILVGSKISSSENVGILTSLCSIVRSLLMKQEAGR